MEYLERNMNDWDTRGDIKHFIAFHLYFVPFFQMVFLLICKIPINTEIFIKELLDFCSRNKKIKKNISENFT